MKNVALVFIILLTGCDTCRVYSGNRATTVEKVTSLFSAATVVDKTTYADFTKRFGEGQGCQTNRVRRDISSLPYNRFCKIFAYDQSDGTVYVCFYTESNWKTPLETWRLFAIYSEKTDDAKDTDNTEIRLRESNNQIEHTR